MAPWRGASGFSLPELLVSLAVVGLVMAGVLTLLQAGLGAYTFGTARAEAQQSARIALQRVVFQRGLNGNGVIDGTHERVSYLLRPGETVLRRDAGGGAQPIIEGVRRLELAYYDRAGASTTDPTRVAAIGIELEVGFSGPAVIVQSHVTLRAVLN